MCDTRPKQTFWLEHFIFVSSFIVTRHFRLFFLLDTAFCLIYFFVLLYLKIYSIKIRFSFLTYWNNFNHTMKQQCLFGVGKLSYPMLMYYYQGSFAFGNYISSLTGVYIKRKRAVKIYIQYIHLTWTIESIYLRYYYTIDINSQL